jgi:hypothetical protein
MNIRFPDGTSSSSYPINVGGGRDDNGLYETNVPRAPLPFNSRSTSAELKKFLRECHIVNSVISLIPESFGVGIFSCLTREDINSLSGDVGIQMLLRAAQALVKTELATPKTPQVVTRPPRPATMEGGIGERPQGPVAPIQELAGGNVNADPYLVSETMNTLAGRTYIYKLYGSQEGGLATEQTRLPSTAKGSFAPKGLFNLNIADLGVNLITKSGESQSNRILLWHSLLMVGHHHHFSAMGSEQWGADTAQFMKSLYLGLSLDVFNRTASQACCSNMFSHQKAKAFSNPRVMMRLLTGNFHPGDNGVQIEDFELTEGGARRNSDTPDVFGRNRGLVECLDSLVAFIRTFVNPDLLDVFLPVTNVLNTSEFLHRTSPKIILKYLNVSYAVLFNGLCITANVKTIAHELPVSIKGIGLFSKALLDVSMVIAGVLSSKSRMKSMEEDLAGRLAEDELRLSMINSFNGMGDLTVISPTKKRKVADISEEVMSSRKLKEKEKKKRKKEKREGLVQSPLATVKVEPGPKPVKGSPVVKRENPCIYHMANKLGLKDSNSVLYKCPRGVKDCLYRHLPLHGIQRDKALKAAGSSSDPLFKALLTTGITGSTDFL